MKGPALLALPLHLAVQRLALAQLDVAVTASARFTERDDAEALHDFRVALRRLRSVLRAYAPWYDPVPKNLNKRLRRLARATNMARDAEVQIEWLRRPPPRLKACAQSGLAWLHKRLEVRQRVTNREVRKVVRKEFAALEPRLRAALRTESTSAIPLRVRASRSHKQPTSACRPIVPSSPRTWRVLARLPTGMISTRHGSVVSGYATCSSHCADRFPALPRRSTP